MNSTETEWWQIPQGGVTATEPRTETSLRPAVEPALDPEKVKKSEAADAVTKEGEEKGPDRRKAILLGAASAALVGVIMFSAIPDDAPASPAGTTSTVAPDTFLPPAGGLPQETGEASSGENAIPTENSQEVPAMKTVVLSMESSGKGDVGAMVNVRIQNSTDSTITVMSSMMYGDNRAAMVGEGTLAPGARRIEPGETVEGTVEFATKKPPSQIVLLDLSGTVVAAS